MNPFRWITDLFSTKAKGDMPPPMSQRGRYSGRGYGSGRFSSLLYDRLPGTNINYSRLAGDLMLNSAVARAVSYITTNWPQCPPRVVRKGSDGNWQEVPNHPLTAILRSPQKGVPASLWYEWLVTDYLILGNAFPRKKRGMRGYGPVVGLQYLPGDTVAPVGNGTDPLTGYEYRVDGKPIPIRLDDMIHIRQGRDPNDWRMGRALVTSCLREVVADNESSTTHVAFTRNRGAKSTLLAPDDSDGKGGVEPPTQDEAKEMKQTIQEQTTGDNSGTMCVLTMPFVAHDIGYTPKDMDFGVLRKTPEERISAIFGIPAVVLGFGAGLERSTYNNMAEARQQAWEDGILPVMAKIADFFTESLLSDFDESEEGDRVEFDSSAVRALMDDMVAAAKRAEALFKAGIIDRATAKRIAGEKAEKKDEGVYFADTRPKPIAPMDPDKPITVKGLLDGTGTHPERELVA